jgi:hypothetical protein
MKPVIGMLFDSIKSVKEFYRCSWQRCSDRGHGVRATVAPGSGVAVRVMVAA